MQFLADLWLPIVVSGLAVFVMSALVWTVLPNHKTEFRGLANEDAVLDALRAGNPAPGKYSLPYMADSAHANSPEARAKLDRGPLVFMTLAPGGMPHMGKLMGLSALFSIVVSACVAYLAWHTVAPGSSYLHVFRITGAATFMAYGLGVIPEAIWFARPSRSVAIHLLDSLLFALVAGGCFGWLWP